jgi:hypothetical protein
MTEINNDFHHIIQRRYSATEPWFDCGPKYFGEDGIASAVLVEKFEAKRYGSDKVRLVRREVVITEDVVSSTDVHTEHCCIRHGCEYGPGDECSVVSGTKPQSFRCEQCDYELEDEGGLELAYAINEVYDLGFKKGNDCSVCGRSTQSLCSHCA